MRKLSLRLSASFIAGLLLTLVSCTKNAETLQPNPNTANAKTTSNLQASMVKDSVRDSLPIADFSFMVGSDSAGLTPVYFTDLSKNAVSFNWKFGDGSSSTLENPVHVYKTPGIYIVSLTVTSSTGKTSTITKLVVVSKTNPVQAPVANFDIVSRDTVKHGDSLIETIQFKNLSKNATSYNWDFGNGTTSADENPIAYYVIYGGGSRSFTVKLTATNKTGKSDSKSEIINIP